ncbi:MAG: hypothetical protein NTW29_14460 [Bacteroidetes bacterium]|nr:hypothetical protein [Bacteroidota bacterium]
MKSILSSLYVDKSAADLSAKLEEYNLFEPLTRTVAQLNVHINEKDKLINECKILPIAHISSNLLVIVNQRIREEKDLEKAELIENLLSDISVEVLKNLYKFIDSSVALTRTIEIALKDTCNLFNYDYTQLHKFLKLESFFYHRRSLQQSEVAFNPHIIPSYIWKGKPIQKAELINILIERKLFLKKARLSKLFEKPDTCLNLEYNPALTNLTLQFFATLKKHKLVTHIGCDGFYKVLSFHLKDFDKVFLNNKQAGTRLNALKQNKTQWIENQSRIDKWVQLFR